MMGGREVNQMNWLELARLFKREHIIFLAAEDTSHITGVEIHVNGGLGQASETSTVLNPE